MRKKKVGAIAIKSLALLVVIGTAYQALADRRRQTGNDPGGFKVTESLVGSTGVILANYERAGAVQTRTFQ